MNKEDNPFFTLAEKFKNIQSNDQKLYYNGTVISISPLIIDIGQLQLDREDILINNCLLKGTKRKAKFIESGNDVNMIDGEIENLEDVFRINDKVILITNDNQTFVLLCIVS